MTRNTIRAVVAVLLPIGCANAVPGTKAVPGTNAVIGTSPRCVGGTGVPSRVFQLYFGRSIPRQASTDITVSPRHGPQVTEQDWIAFRDEVISANLPNGYTVMDAEGAWKEPGAMRTVTERTKVLVTVMPDQPDSIEAVNRVRAAYQARFHQRLVGLAVQPACASF